jgi:hypothetical protein
MSDKAMKYLWAAYAFVMLGWTGIRFEDQWYGVAMMVFILAALAQTLPNGEE